LTVTHNVAEYQSLLALQPKSHWRAVLNRNQTPRYGGTW
jgi:hypothetical protein